MVWTAVGSVSHENAGGCASRVGWTAAWSVSHENAGGWASRVGWTAVGSVSHENAGGAVGSDDGVHDVVLVALFGQEPLAVEGEVLLDGLGGDERVEARLTALRSEDPPQPLCLFLA